jgi:hypothetical protein
MDYTVTGYGGLSPNVSGVSKHHFWWAAANTPGADLSGSVLRSFAFDPLAGAVRGVTPAPYLTIDLYTSGSLLLSIPFTVTGTQKLTVAFGSLAVQKFAWDNFQFATLVQNSQVVAILGLSCPMSLTGTAEQAYLGTNFTPLTAGVQSTAASLHAAYPGSFQLGSIQYNQCSGDKAGPCQDEVVSTYTPTAGTYQLLLGSFSQGRNGPVAVAVKSVAVN